MASLKHSIAPLELSGWDDDHTSQKQVFTPYLTLSIQNQMNRERRDGITFKNRKESYRYKGSARDTMQNSMAICWLDQQQKPRFLEMKTIALPGVQGRKYRWSQETKQYFKLRSGRQIDQRISISTHKNHNFLSPVKNTRASLINKPLSLQLKQSPQMQSELPHQLIQYLKYRQKPDEKGSCVFQKPFSKVYRKT